MDFGLSAAVVMSLLIQVAATKPNDPIVVTGSKLDRLGRVCQKVSPPGSRLVTKVICGTPAEWAEREQQDREALNEVIRRNLQLNAPPH